jgi:hypothetical protein
MTYEQFSLRKAAMEGSRVGRVLGSMHQAGYRAISPSCDQPMSFPGVDSACDQTGHCAVAEEKRWEVESTRC